MSILVSVLTSPVVRGALSGLVAAAIVDVHAFMRWRSVQEAIAFDWRTAALRWAQGAVGGALMAVGLGGLA